MAIIRQGTITDTNTGQEDFDDNHRLLEVVNVNGAGKLWFTVDGDTPTIDTDNTHVLPAQISAKTVIAKKPQNTVIKMLADGGDVEYAIEVLDN